MKNVIFVNSHPIQYFTPLYKYLNENGTPTKAWYCSDETIKGGYDEEFGVEIKWDIPLLDGYEYSFFKNHSAKPSLYKGFFGLINFGMIKQLMKEPPSVIIVHGWNYFTHFLILMLGKFKKHTICIRNDMPLKQEYLKKGSNQIVKKIGLKYVLFPRINYFLFIGSQNKMLYQDYGIPEKQLLSVPYAVDNERFYESYLKLKPHQAEIKKKLGIPETDRVILSTAKYINKKRPLDLIRAFHKLNKKDCWLIMVGEGELREEMEAYIEETKLERVILTGFVNQSSIPEYYAMSDVFVMCSAIGENWGLSVNEAMNFDLPVILSDLTGCSDDLVESGVNGYVFKTEEIDELKECLKNILEQNTLSWKRSSKNIVDEYSFEVIRQNLQMIR